MIALAGWKAAWAERRARKDLKEAYDNLVVAHQKALRQAQERCPMCDELERERDNALLRLEEVELRLDSEISTRIWCEGMLRGQVK